MSLSGDLSGKGQPETSNVSSAGSPEAVTGAGSTSSAPPSVGKDFRGIFSARINTRGPRLGFLAGGVVLWALCGAAMVKAFFLALSPLSGLEVSFLEMSWSDVTDLNWYGVPWLIVLLLVVAAIVAAGLAFFSLRRWKSLRRLPRGIVGDGIRVLPDGAVELGTIKIRPASLRGVSATGRGHIESVRWKRVASYSGEREILINILRTAKRGLMVGHILLKVASGQEAMFLEFLQSRFAKQSTLWVTSESEIIWLNRAAVDVQLETVSSVLAPIARRKGGLLTLTLTELAADAGKSGSKRAAFGAMGPSAAGGKLISATNSLQARANEQLAAGSLPSGLSDLAGIVDKYSYKLKPNPDAKSFRGW